MVLRESLIILNLLTQNPKFEVPDVSIFDIDTVNTKVDTNATILPAVEAQSDEKKIKNNDDNVSFLILKEYFWNQGLGLMNYGLNGKIMTNVPYGKLKAFPYFELENAMNNNNDNISSLEQKAKAGTTLNITSKDQSGCLTIEPSAEFSRKDYRNQDTLTNSENKTEYMQDGVYWINSRDIQTSDETRKDIGKFFGFGTVISGKKNKTVIQFGINNNNSNSKIITLDNFTENYKDSTYTNQGLPVMGTTDLVTRVLTNNETNSKNKIQDNFWRFFYEHQLGNKTKWNLGVGATLQNHIIENELRNKTYVTTDINGQTIVTVYGNNGTYVDTLLVSTHSESSQNSRDYSRVQVNTDLLSFLIGLSKGNVNNRLYFDKAFFNSKEWALKNQIDYNIRNFTNALSAQINNSSFGFEIVLAYENIPLKFKQKLDSYMNDKEELLRDVSKNDKQKELIQNYKNLELLEKLYGYYTFLDFERVGGGKGYCKFKGELGYSALDNLKARGGVVLEKDHKKFYAGGGNKTFDGNLFYEIENIEGNKNSWKLGAEAKLRFSD